MTARWRAAGLTVAAGTLTTLAHLVVASPPAGPAAGAVPAPTPAALLAVLVVSGTAVLVLGRRRLPGWQVAAGLTVAQLGQHLCLPTAAHGSLHSGGRTGLMVLAHAAAAIVTAALLGYGETAVTALCTWLHWLRPVRRQPTPAQVRPPRVPPVVRIRRRPGSALGCGPGLRGPPALFAPR
jgi:hypothetical protein